MNTDAVEQLSAPLGQQALALAAQQTDPSSLSAAQVLRARFPAELAAVALTQAELRRRAVPKFGAAAGALFFTRDGLEQATRPEVAAHHAARFAAAGVTRVVDLGCGVGSDALAMLGAGLEVMAVEIDPVTAQVARLNLGGRAEVILGDAELLAEDLLRPGDGVFCDPARRSTAGRLWRVADFTPSWPFVAGLLQSGRVTGVKLGPALPHTLIPPGVEAEWVSHRGATVEVGLWAGPGSEPDGRMAHVLPAARMAVAAEEPALAVSAARRYVYEPDGAVIRAGGVASVGTLVQGALLDPKIAYLTSDVLVQTPFASAFEVVAVLPYQEKALRRWLREHDMGAVEIKKRGVDVDPAELRKRLGPHGADSCTVILTRTPRGALALVVRRVPGRAG